MSKIQELKQLLKGKASYIHSERDLARNLKQEGRGKEANSIHNKKIISQIKEKSTKSKKNSLGVKRK